MGKLAAKPGGEAWTEGSCVEPEIIDYGLTLSPRVAKAAPRLVEEARRVLARWAQQDRV